MALNGLIQINNRKETIEILKHLHGKGYRYVVREQESPYLVCFSLKPKRFIELEVWGYANVEANGVMMAYPIKNEDITEIHWNNRSATLIADILKEETK